MSEAKHTRSRTGGDTGAPQLAPGWKLEALLPPAALIGANGMRMGPDGLLYVAQAFGSQISSVDPATGAARVVSAADGAIIAPDDLAFDSHGNLYATEVMSARVSVIRPNGAIDVIAGDVPVANGITVHADRIFMSEFRPEGRIWELYADGAAPRLIASGLMMPNALCLGPDGWLYFPLVPLGEVWRVPVEGGAAQRVVGGLDIPTAVKFDPAGRLVVVESGSGAVTRVDIGTGSASLFAQVAYGIDNLAFAPDGRLFVSHFTDGEVIEIAPDGTRRVAVAGGLSGPYGLCAGADGTVRVADGMSIAAVATDGTVDRPAMLLQHGFPGYVRGVAEGAEGAWIVTNSAGQCCRYRPGGEAEVLADSLDEAMGVLRHGDDIYLCEAGAGRVLGIDSAGAVRVVAGGLERPTGIAVANDGGLLVTEAAGGRLLHLSACGEAATVMNGMSEPHGVACTRGSIFVIDRATASLHCVDPHGVASVIAEDLPTGPGKGIHPNVLPGIADLMPGPLLPFADLCAMPCGSLIAGADTNGSLLSISPA
ncbi:Vgb family protein [Novosphingobium colocasiae]|uniref:Gluconolaconase n=1 Tax=Novosphingobium colocasiae TaxID=1256513 RepID=A0A918P8H2_9SPHN|nr:gluconolaconase [Novosphingobium colocasiae]GGY90594.1 gluconolaconase [Novosphingobium colocasiae]